MFIIKTTYQISNARSMVLVIIPVPRNPYKNGFKNKYLLTSILEYLRGETSSVLLFSSILLRDMGLSIIKADMIWKFYKNKYANITQWLRENLLSSFGRRSRRRMNLLGNSGLFRTPVELQFPTHLKEESCKFLAKNLNFKIILLWQYSITLITKKY